MTLQALPTYICTMIVHAIQIVAFDGPNIAYRRPRDGDESPVHLFEVGHAWIAQNSPKIDDYCLMHPDGTKTLMRSQDFESSHKMIDEVGIENVTSWQTQADEIEEEEPPIVAMRVGLPDDIDLNHVADEQDLEPGSGSSGLEHFTGSDNLSEAIDSPENTGEYLDNDTLIDPAADESDAA